MTEQLLNTDHLLDLLFIASVVALLSGAVGYHRARDRLATVGGVVGFGLFGLIMVYLVGHYAGTDGSDRFFLMGVAGTGAIISFQGIRLVVHGWERAGQLTTVAAITTLVVVPLEVFPSIPVALQEAFATQTLIILGWLGYEGSLAYHAGGYTQLTFANDVTITVIRECTGIDGIALFGALVLAARTTWRRKALGLGFVLAVVYLVNSLRLVFINAAMAGDWFGPYLTSENTLEMTYLVAEVIIGQSVVILATIAGFLLLSRYIPDLMAFVTALFSSFVPSERRLTQVRTALDR